MGSNKTFQQKGDRGRVLGESSEFRRLRHAVERAAGDREHAIRNVCRRSRSFSTSRFTDRQDGVGYVHRQCFGKPGGKRTETIDGSKWPQSHLNLP
jgi:hypothetical protein